MCLLPETHPYYAGILSVAHHHVQESELPMPTEHYLCLPCTAALTIRDLPLYCQSSKPVRESLDGCIQFPFRFVRGEHNALHDYVVDRLAENMLQSGRKVDESSICSLEAMYKHLESRVRRWRERAVVLQYHKEEIFG